MYQQKMQALIVRSSAYADSRANGTEAVVGIDIVCLPETGRNFLYICGTADDLLKTILWNHGQEYSDLCGDECTSHANVCWTT